MPFALLLPALLAGAAPQGAATCPATPAPLPTALAGWKAGAALTAGMTAAHVASLTLGARSDVSFGDAAGVAWVVAPGKPAGTGSKGGLLAFHADRRGTYRIAIGTGAWIDVVGNGKSVQSVAHQPGPACSGIRKMVDFALTPGSYVVQVSGADVGATGMLVTRLP